MMGRGEILAIDHATYAAMCSVIGLMDRGAHFSIEEAAARAGLTAARPATPTRQQPGASGGAVAVVPIVGFMSHRPSFMSMIFGGTSTAEIAGQVRRAAADPNVSALALEVDSPGGSVDGVEELAATIASAARQKPVTAVVDTLAASAAYWAISGASEIVASPSGRLGSIGTVATHTDLSKAAEREGITNTFVTSSRYKAEGHSFAPLSAEARDNLQRMVDEYDRVMTNAIASGRRVSVDRVRADFGQGRIVLARDAVRRGMADRLGTLEETLGRLVSAPGGRQPAGASADLRQRVAVAALSRRPPREASDDLERLKLRLKVAEASR